MSVARSVWLALMLAATTLPKVDRAEAASVGAWSKTCTAPNWQTGVPEPAQEMNVDAPAATYWGFTSMQAGGRWLIQYNTGRIFGPTGTQTVLMFLFYHECAHAQFATSDERIADCMGLAAMRKDMEVTASMIAEITLAYNSVGRSFPSGPC